MATAAWRVALGLGLLAAAGCASAPPRAAAPPKAAAPRVALRTATPVEARMLRETLLPLMQTAGLWRPGDRCAAAVAVRPGPRINVTVGRHRTCVLALLFSEGAFTRLTPDELRGTLAHELGHVTLGHMANRTERRAAEREERRELAERTDAAGVAAGIPVLGPLVALGVAGAEAAGEEAIERTYRAYDREEEREADRYALTLLDTTPGRHAGCLALVAALERIAREPRPTRVPEWRSTHPMPGDRLETARLLCPAGRRAP